MMSSPFFYYCVENTSGKNYGMITIEGISTEWVPLILSHYSSLSVSTLVKYLMFSLTLHINTSEHMQPL